MKIWRKFKMLINDESAASAAEYAVLLAIVAVGIVLAMQGLAAAISNATDSATAVINGTP